MTGYSTDRTYWRDLARVAVRLANAADADIIAGLCVTTALAGGKPSVWHAAATFYHTACPCGECNKRAK